MSTITLTINQWTSNNNICCSQLLRPSTKTSGHVDARWFGHGVPKYHNTPTTEILQTGWLNMATCSFTASRSWTLVLLRHPEVATSKTSTLHKNTIRQEHFTRTLHKIRWPQHCYSKFPSLWEHVLFQEQKTLPFIPRHTQYPCQSTVQSPLPLGVRPI